MKPANAFDSQPNIPLALDSGAVLTRTRGRPRTGEGGKTTDARKQSIYMKEGMLDAVKTQAARLDRSISWVIARAWKIAEREIAEMPAVSSMDTDD